MIKGYCAVTADILHTGHIRFIKTAKLFCDFLVVGVMSDAYIRYVKMREPIMSFKERSAIIKALKYVGEVVGQNGYAFDRILKLVKPDIVFESTKHKREVPGHIERMLIKYHEGISSTIIKEKILDTYNRKRKA